MAKKKVVPPPEREPTVKELIAKAENGKQLIKMNKDTIINIENEIDLLKPLEDPSGHMGQAVQNLAMGVQSIQNYSNNLQSTVNRLMERAKDGKPTG